MSKNMQAILWMVLQAVATSLLFVVGKFLDKDYNIFQIIFVYHVISFILVAIYASKTQFKEVKYSCIKAHLGRTVFTVLGYILYFQGLQTISLGASTAISYSLIIFMTMLGVAIYKEKMTKPKVFSIIASVIGMIIILKPEAGEVNIGGLLITGCVFAWSMANIFIKYLGGKRVNVTNQMFYYYLMGSVLLLPLALPQWQCISNSDLFLLFILAICATAQVSSLSKAFALGDFSVVMPIDYIRLPITAILGYMFFGEVLDNNTIIGSLIIVASSLYLIKKEA